MRIQEDSFKGIAVRYFFRLTIWRLPKYRLKAKAPQDQRIFKIIHGKAGFVPAVCQAIAGMDKAVVISGIFSNHPLLVTGTEKPVGMGIISYPTLGGLFELYTPEEYKESVNQIKKYMGADHEDVKAMEADLANSTFLTIF